MTFIIKNCKITVSFLFLAVLAIFLLCNDNNIAQSGICAAFIHELGHLIFMFKFGFKLIEIKFTPFGIDIIKSSNLNQSYLKDAFISLSGSAVNLAVIPVFSLLNYNYFYYFILANAALGIFNLLPIEPLDGGQALYSLLCIRFSSEKSAKIVSVVSFIVLIPIAVLGFIILFKLPGNFSLLILCVYLMFLLIFKNGRYY